MIEANNPLNGIWCPALTPVDELMQPDVVRLVDHCRFVLDEGCHGLVIFGTTGEANSFSVDERIATLNAVISAGLPPEKIMVGTGCPALTDTIRLTRHALDQGVCGILMLPPYYYKGASDDALAASYDQVIQGVGSDDFRLVLYHIPQMSGVPITHGLIEKLKSAYPTTVAGVKDSTGNWENTKALLASFPELAIYPGAENLLPVGLEHGAAGCISAGCNVNARAIRKLYDAARAGQDIGAIHEQVEGIRKILTSHALIPTMKQMIADHRSDPAWCLTRPPLMTLSAAEAGEVRAELAALDFRLAA
jgi:4-hydroxy-tetrahydrodipicolinate synthase